MGREWIDDAAAPGKQDMDTARDREIKRDARKCEEIRQKQLKDLIRRTE